MLTTSSQTFTITDLNVEASTAISSEESPVVLSLLRDFSAPVSLNMDCTADDLAFLIKHETNGFNRWQATQMLVNKILQHSINELSSSPTSVVDELNNQSYQTYIDAYIQALSAALPELATSDPMLCARLLDIPSERELATTINDNYQPQIIKQVKTTLKQQLASALQTTLQNIYDTLCPLLDDTDSPTARGNRALVNAVLDLLVFAVTYNSKEENAKEENEKEEKTKEIDTPTKEFINQLVSTQYDQATTMTQRLGALNSMVNYQLPIAQQYLNDFYQRFEDNPLVMDMWFSVQASAYNVDTKEVQALLMHEKFDWGTPNRVRSVVGGLASRPASLWSEEGLSIYTDVVAKLDTSNPVLASRLLNALSRWYTLTDELKTIARTKLTELSTRVTSKNVTESLQNTLSA